MELIWDILKWSAIIGGLALILTLLKPLLDRRYSAKWRYGAWLAMAVFLLLAPVQWEALMPQAPVSPPVVIEVPQVEVSVSRREGVSFQRPAAKPASPVRRPAQPAAKTRVLPLDTVLTCVWAAGTALFLLYHLTGTWLLNRRARRWSRPAGEDSQRVYQAVRQDMGLKSAPELCICSRIDSPMVAGLLRPRLLLPTEEFGEMELAFILRHELTHCRRHDLWYKLALLAANGLHWFNPLIYLLRREAERDLELTCDDAVVAGEGADVRRAYSETLLASVHRQKALSRAALSTHFYGGKEVMKERFRNILGARGRKWGVLALALVLLAAVAAACTFGVKTSDGGALSEAELAKYQELVSSENMRRYVTAMYSDVSYLPPEGLFTPGDIYLGTAILQGPASSPTVTGGTRTGGTVTLELEGTFASGLPTGTLTLVNDKPVSFTTPLYTAVETAARELMDETALEYMKYTEKYLYSSDLEESKKALIFEERYITNLFCTESLTIDGKTFYVWELYYRMKPNDLNNVMFAGGMSEDNGWVTETSSVGSPMLVFSVDSDGNITHEGTTFNSVVWEDGFTWEEYLYCEIYLGMPLGDVLNGWPDWDTDFLDDLRHGRETWAEDWQKTFSIYLNRVYGLTPQGDPSELRTFQADEAENSHDEAVLAQAVCGERTVTLLLAHVIYPVEVWDTTMEFWQVCGEIWDPPFQEAAGLEGTRETNEMGDQVMLFENKGMTLAFPVRDAQGNFLPDDYIINPEDDHHASSYEVLFDIHHRQTYQTQAGHGMSGQLLEIVKWDEDNYQIQRSNGFPEENAFAVDEQGNYYCLVFPDSQSAPPEAQKAMDAFLDSQEYRYMIADFTSRNGLAAIMADDDLYVLTEDELVSFTSYFNTRQHNGLLRTEYDGNFDSIIPYLEIILYDVGNSVTDHEERDTLIETYFEGDDPDTDCFKLTSEEVRNYLASNFVMPTNQDEALDNALEQLKQQLFYLEEYDSYYMVHGDTMQAGYTFEGGEKDSTGNWVKLNYRTDLWQYDGTGELDLLWDIPMTAMLVRSVDGWSLLANVIRTN